MSACCCARIRRLPSMCYLIAGACYRHEQCVRHTSACIQVQSTAPALKKNSSAMCECGAQSAAAHTYKQMQLLTVKCQPFGSDAQMPTLPTELRPNVEYEHMQLHALAQIRQSINTFVLEHSKMQTDQQAGATAFTSQFAPFTQVNPSCFYCRLLLL